MSKFGFRLTALLLTVSLGAVPLKVHAEESAGEYTGSFGDNITWTLEEDTLYLQGSGATEEGTFLPLDFTSIQPLTPETTDQWYNPKWTDIAPMIKKIVVSEGITEIEPFALCLFPNLESAELPDSLESVGNLAFMGCPNLKELRISPQTAVSHTSFWGDSGLYSENQTFLILNDFRLIDYVGTEQSAIAVPDEITVIGEGVFATHAELQSVRIPNHVSEIGRAAFSGCTELKTITLPETLTVIEPFLFSGCAALETIRIPSSVSSVGTSAFDGCTALQEITIPDSVSDIGANAFYGCTSLTSIAIPDTVQSVQTGAFFKTPWLADAGDYVVVGDGILYAFQGRQKILHIPETVKTVNTDAVKSDKIMEVICPPSVTEIQTGGIQGKYLTIVGTSGTAAEAYAVQNGIPFRDMNAEPPQGTDMTLDFEKDIWSFGNSGKVFGGDYYLSDTDRERLTELGISTSSNQSWGGSCVGLSVTVILAKNGIFAPVQLQSGADSLAEIEPTEDVVSFINYFQRIQGRSDASSAYEHDDLMFCRMVNTAKNVQYGESPFLLTFATKNGSHAVVGYGQESGKWTYDGKTYDARILVWDSNSPNALRDSSCLYYDSETFDYCIPQYGVHVAEGESGNTAGIITVCNDLDVLNAYPYPFELHYQTGDINCDGKVSVADAVLLSRFLTAQTELTDSQMMLADLSGDKKLNAADLTVLKRQLLYQSNVKA